MHFFTPLFSQARLKLTFGYTLFFGCVILVFSLAFYTAQVRTLRNSRQLPQVIAQQMQQQVRQLSPEQHQQVADEITQRFTIITTELERSLLRSILFLDLIAIAACIGVSYVLAVLSLMPVERSYQHQQQFLQDVSHELRTPLAVIQAELDLARSRHSKKQHKKLDISALLISIQEEVVAMTNLVDQILHLARISNFFEAGPTREETQANLASVVTKVTKAFASRIKAKRQVLTVSLEQQLPAVTGSNETWEHIIQILLDNAIKYTPDTGRIEIKVAKKKSKMLVSVSDTGIGIDDQDLDHIFERFYRADESRSSQGTGLGLSIAQQLVKGLGGTIEVKSQINQGTTFNVVTALA